MNSSTQPAAHTPTPWRAAKSPNIYGPKGEYVACAVENEADRELIARAVNAHADLVAFANNAVPLLYLFKALLNETWLDAKPALRTEIEKKISAVAQVCKAGDRLIDAEALKTEGGL